MAQKRGPYAKSDQRRQTLGKAALDLVRRHGHRNVSVSEIAEVAETSEATVSVSYTHLTLPTICSV